MNGCHKPKGTLKRGGGKRLPAVFHKKNNAPILVTMEFDDFMNIYREWEAGHDLKEG